MRRQFATASLAVAGLISAMAHAAPLATDQWYTFGFGAAGSAAVDGAGFALGSRSLASGDPAWSFSNRAPLRLLVTDGFNPGDHFEVFDHGVSIGQTSDVDSGAVSPCHRDEVACLADPTMSHASFLLQPGAHELTIRVIDSPFGGGAAFFCLDTSGACSRSVPVPGTVALLGLGIAGLLSRRRSRG